MKVEKPSVPSTSSLSRGFYQVGYVISLLGYTISLLGVVACAIFVCPFVLQIAGGICLGILMSSGESIVHSIPGPDNQITALVVSDSCGVTCGCTVRVDLTTDDQHVEEIWRGIDVCDATVTWLSATELNIVDDKEQQTQIDIRVLGLSP